MIDAWSSHRAVRIVLLCGTGSIACALGCAERSLDETTRRALYERSDRVFTAGDLFRPPDSTVTLDPALAPLLIREGDAGERPVGPVYHTASSIEIRGARLDQRTFLWRQANGKTPRVQGVRVTYGTDGFALVFEALSDRTGAHLLFVSSDLEAAASAQFGEPLNGRRFAIERAVDATPDVVVAALVEPGPLPLGPFVYVDPGGDVSTVLCRCAPSQIETIRATVEYELIGLDGAPPAWLAEPPHPPALEPLLRWPAAAIPVGDDRSGSGASGRDPLAGARIAAVRSDAARVDAANEIVERAPR